MPRKSMSLNALYSELLQVSPQFGWNALLNLLRWQLEQGNEVGFSFGFYAKKIILASRQEQARERERVASLRKKSAPENLSAIMHTALNVHG